jgi:hypothetical protein
MTASFKYSTPIKAATLLSGMLLFFIPADAHVVVNELEKMSKIDTAFLYIKLGYEHILPLGFDHILFVLSLFLVNPRLKPLLLQASIFTVAHSVTLALAMYHVIKPSPAVVEPLIALSIVFVAVENIIFSRVKASRYAVVFLFGLVHGMGFASALSQLGLPQNAFLPSLIMFNVGVELGQLTVILGAYFLVAKWLANKDYYRKIVVVPMSLIIVGIASFWTIQRLLF